MKEDNASTKDKILGKEKEAGEPGDEHSSTQEAESDSDSDTAKKDK